MLVAVRRWSKRQLKKCLEVLQIFAKRRVDLEVFANFCKKY